MVSIIIVNYNTKKFIIPCLESIKKYAPKGAEVIVIDNNSSDGSVEALNDLRFNNKDLRLIENQKNLGYARAVNQGIKAANGDYLFVLNPDTRLTKSVINQLLNFTLLHKGVSLGVVSPRLLNMDGSVQASCYHEPTIIGAAKEYFFGIKGAFGKYAPRGDEPVIVDAVVGAAMFIPCNTINKVGLFNESYFMYFEDLDYCRKARNAGLKIYYLPTAKVYHAHGGVTKTVGDKARQWLVESSLVYHGKMMHTFITITLWLGQKFRRLFR